MLMTANRGKFMRGSSWRKYLLSTVTCIWCWQVINSCCHLSGLIACSELVAGSLLMLHLIPVACFPDFVFNFFSFKQSDVFLSTFEHPQSESESLCFPPLCGFKWFSTNDSPLWSSALIAEAQLTSPPNWRASRWLSPFLSENSSNIWKFLAKIATEKLRFEQHDRRWQNIHC